MNQPIVITDESYQVAWAKVIIELQKNQWDLWNLVVQIEDPTINDERVTGDLCEFAEINGLITPERVEHTIFPTRLYRKYPEKTLLYRAYRKYFTITRKMDHSGWGTYFQSMIHYPTEKGYIDQLGDIIEKIKERPITYRTAYVMLIPEPERDRNKIMAAPCLNYIALQLENEKEQRNGRQVSLLAVYRNHDFMGRAYGNYLGLCSLLKYICKETNSSIGCITCISSHAFVEKNKSELFDLALAIKRG